MYPPANLVRPAGDTFLSTIGGTSQTASSSSQQQQDSSRPTACQQQGAQFRQLEKGSKTLNICIGSKKGPKEYTHPLWHMLMSD